jgi:rubrerythrin
MPRREEPPLNHVWICEDCATVFEGVDPPDECNVCAHKYFANLQDMVDEHERA